MILTDSSFFTDTVLSSRRNTDQRRRALPKRFTVASSVVLPQAEDLARKAPFVHDSKGTVNKCCRVLVPM